MTVLEDVSEVSAAVSQMRETLLKIADPINQDLQLARPSNDGAGSGGRSHRGEISIVMKDFHKAWKQRGTKKHWVVRMCVNSPMLGISVAEL